MDKQNDAAERTARDAEERRADESLVALLRSGGAARQAGITQLFNRYAREFQRYFRRHGLNAETAEDLMQETFIRITAAVDTYRADGMLGAWVWQIARNALLTFFRTANRTVSIDGMEEHEADHLLAATLDNGLDPATIHCARRALADFQRQQRDCFEALMRMAVDGWDYDQLARFRDSTYGATREYVSQCRKRLEELTQPCFEGAR